MARNMASSTEAVADEAEQPLLTRAQATTPESDAPVTSPSSTLPLHRQVDVSDDVSKASGPSTYWPCTFNMCKVIVGSGLMAIPRAFLCLGFWLGSSLLAMVALLTYYTMAILVQGRQATGAVTYAELVQRTVGRTASWVLQGAVMMFCYGFLVVYLVVLKDVLVGEDGQPNGLLNELLGVGEVWFLDKKLVLGVLLLVCFLPLTSLRSMANVTVVVVLGVLAISFFALCTVVLLGAAYCKGLLKPFVWGPRLDLLGSTALTRVMAMAGVVPILLTAEVGHQGVFPLIPLLKPYSRKTMDSVIAGALIICNVIFFVVPVAMVWTFGDDLNGDALNNISVSSLSPLVGEQAAVIMSYSVRAGYGLALVGSFVVYIFPLRDCLAELLFEDQTTALGRSRVFYPMTYSVVGSVYLFAVVVPNLWYALSFIGAISTTLQAFIIPGLVGYKLHSWGVARTLDVFVVCLGAVLLVNGCIILFWKQP